MVAEGTFFSVMVGAGEAYVPAFALAAGHGEAAAGLVATLPIFLGALLQLVTPWGVKRLRSHRRWVVAAATCQAFSFLPLAAGALHGSIGLPWIFLGAAAYWGFGMASGPAWNTWVDDLIPTRIRARFFAARNRALQATLFVALASAGALLQWRSGTPDGGIAVFAVLFAAACAARLVSARLLARQSEPHPELPETRQVTLGAFLSGLRGTPQGRLLRHLLAMTMAVHVAAPYFTPYMLRHLGLSYGEFTALTAAVFVSRIVALPLLGRIAHRSGSRALLWTSATGIVVLPSLWLVSDHLAWLLTAQLLSGVAWAAFELSTTLAFFEGIDRRERTSVLTMYNFSNAGALGIGAIAGGLFFRFVPESDVYAWLFLASSLARALALRLLWPVGTLGVPRVAVVLRTLAIRPNEGALQRPIVATLEPGEADATFQPIVRP
jgi:MFS family permease